MTCQVYDERLGDYVDGTLAADEVVRVEAHLAACPRCRALAADFEAIRAMARTLEPHVPPSRVWHAVASATRPRRTDSLAAWFRGWQPAAATAAIAIVVTSLSWIGGRLATLAPMPADIRAEGAAPDMLFVDVAHDAAEAHYVSAIASLEALTSTERAALEPEMVDVLDSGMTVIDTAIDQSRAALEREPGSQIAQDSLFQALRNKVALLQGTLTLVDEMRRSDRDGTEAVPPEMNQ